MWFGSSAGVTLTKDPVFLEGRKPSKWIKEGWFVPLSYTVGFVVIMGWLKVIELLGIHSIAWMFELAMFFGYGYNIWSRRQRN